MVGGDEVQQELEQIQSVQEIKYKQILKSLNSISEKSRETEKNFRNKGTSLAQQIFNTNKNEQELLAKLHMTELVVLAHQVIDNIGRKYEMLRDEPIQPDKQNRLYEQIE
uniref:Uncharacterized protein n=1 Tax=Anopheles aquasalis TaxID=42839 RepID=T1DHV4_ANOAQ